MSSLHAHPRNQCYERPNRTAAVFDRLAEEGVLSKVRALPSRSVQPPPTELLAAIGRVHDASYMSRIMESGRGDAVGEARRAELNAQADIFVTVETAR